MEFRVLGAVEAWAGGDPVDLGSPKQRLVLAVLLLEAGKPVPRDRIIDLLWPEEPPASARNTVQALVSRLRAVFRGAGGPEIVSEGTRYLLRVDPRRVDVHRFTELTSQAREADDETAVELLDEALGLWRGEALSDVVSGEVAQRLRGGMNEERWTALEDRADAQLRLGRGRQVLAELTELVAAHPLRQRFVGQLMLALHREGRTDDALEAFRALRDRLGTELGLDPSPELRRLEAAILAADPALEPLAAVTKPEPIRPAQLPHDVRGFAGRASELERLDEATRHAGEGTDIWVISGTAGVGKTALAVRWAHRVRDAFPDGQLYLDLRGFDPDHEPLTPAVALTQLLQALGTAPKAIPPDTDTRAALLRSLLADRRVLLVLDNVRDTGQVLPLLPPSGTVLVTSRQRLGDLIARTGARALPLSVLPAEDARHLLEAVLGSETVAAEAVAAAELARLCGHLPLALRIAAANLGASGEPEIAELARELAGGDPLAELTVDGAEESAVTTAFGVSYRALPEEHRLLFRRLALVPGQTFTAPAAQALTGAPHSKANQQLKALAAAHLVERYTPGRYRFHDLLRSFAAGRTLSEDAKSERDTAERRLFESYLTTADAAGRVLIPHFLRLPREEPEDKPFGDTEEALAWLDAEWPNLAAAVEHSAEHGPPEFSWHLADALRAFFHQRGHHAEWIDTASTALKAARRSGAGQAQAAMHLSIALACVNSGRYDEAREHLTSALRGDLLDGWDAGRAAVLNNLSAVHQRLGAPQEAIRCGLESLRLCEELNLPGISMALANLGFPYWQTGQLDEALANFTRALTVAERDGARFSVAVLLVDLGNVHRDLGLPDGAYDFYTRALAANRELGYTYGEATALSGRAVLESKRDPSEQNRADALEAVELTRKIGDRGTEAWTLVGLGEVCLRLGLPEEAAEHHRLALSIARTTSFFWCEAAARTGLAETLLTLGKRAEARTHGELALELAARSGYRLVEERAKLILDEL
ncbi:AfsR/SARP family transcriptional regulator [Amycolatopsis azurea]|uniref:Transcriptional regulator n=1 Tax=Amycolatopsis azurea DSM 43854 TaxID=1238180 RepID=M2PTR8_9PSEU|nr:AfsR/SARP family transcriptional regulator [Amycolatopsis azurea]EMD27963.1 putative transcriptional regulator [Amycolatopsis azurea DSM 43854]OOC03429.1 transcriptional regulator [Amycolatopsis azurea DSM 43854]